jgi:hypothetical protein
MNEQNEKRQSDICKSEFNSQAANRLSNAQNKEYN